MSEGGSIMKSVSKILACLVLLMAAAIPATLAAAQGDSAAAAKESANAAKECPPQTLCPIMGGEIDKKVFVDVSGYRIYACCKGCIEKIQADPEKAIAAIRAKGECPESRLEVCPKCGEIKGAKCCCKADAVKCGKCGLDNGSPGCCRDLKDGTVLCPKCGEVKGSADCCKAGAEKCGKCSLDKGSPGCCKQDVVPAP
jgi:hypothetical protein